jgi:hypothetical protein
MANREGEAPGFRAGDSGSTVSAFSILAITEPRRALVFCWNWDMSTLPLKVLTRFIMDFMSGGRGAQQREASRVVRRAKCIALAQF